MRLHSGLHLLSVVLAVRRDRGRDGRGQGAARFRHAGTAGRCRRRGAGAERIRRGRSAGQRGMDQRGRTRRAAGDGQDHEGPAAARPGPDPADPDRDRRGDASICSPAAARMCAPPARSAAWRSARSRRRAARTAASICISSSDGAAMAEALGPMALYRRRVAEGALIADPAQRLAVEKLQLLAMRLADYNPAKPKSVGLGRFGWGRDRLEQRRSRALSLWRGRARQVDADGFVLRTAPVDAEAPGAFPCLHAGGPRGDRRRARAGVSDPIRPVADAVADGATLLVLRRDADHRHHRRDAGRPAVRAAVRARRGGGDDLEPRRRTSSTRTG